MTNRPLIGWGEPVPWFATKTAQKEVFQFSSLAGRFVLLVFLGDSKTPAATNFIKEASAKISPPDTRQLVIFGVSSKENDLKDNFVGTVFRSGGVFLDPDFKIAKSFRTVSEAEDGRHHFRGAWYLLDPTLRVYDRGGLGDVDRLAHVVRTLPEAKDHAQSGAESWAPVLMVPRVLHPDFCRELVDVYRQGVPRQSGFMREIDGRTVACRDASFKRRQDVHITDPAQKAQLNRDIFHRLRPEIKMAFQFDATRIERYIVARYAAEDRGFFRAHRDNTTGGTAHRRFAVTINLNADEFDGGGLRFPEYGSRVYKAPTGGAIVFSCSLLHEAMPVTAGERFATLPFLYDEASVEIRKQNATLIDDEPDEQAMKALAQKSAGDTETTAKAGEEAADA